jgi:hypothetical protein
LPIVVIAAEIASKVFALFQQRFPLSHSTNVKDFTMRPHVLVSGLPVVCGLFNPLMNPPVNQTRQCKHQEFPDVPFSMFLKSTILE